MRLFVARLEVVVGTLLLVLCIGHFGWCQWSLPRYGHASPHGLETSVCNWGTELAGMIFGVVALLTLASGLIGYRVRGRAYAWYAAQTPAVLAWAWMGYGLIYSFLVYPG